jgi:hypothetical protein
MTTRYLLILLLLILCGCAVYDDKEIAQFHRLGVPPALLAKLEHRRALLPDDLIALRRLRVPDNLVIRHLNDVGVDYISTRTDVLRLRKADVRRGVIEALLVASERFAIGRLDTTDYDPWVFDDPWFWPGAYGGLSFGYSSHSGHGGHDHHHHGHH